MRSEKKTNLKVGDTLEVVEVLESHYPDLYNPGDTGVVKSYLGDGAIIAFVGITIYRYTSNAWFLPKENYKPVGRLVVTKVK